MPILKFKKLSPLPSVLVCAVLFNIFTSCKGENIKIINPDIITEQSLNDTDDPAIWVNQNEPSNSIVFGTDKDTNGAIYAFDLDGKILENKTLRNIKRPNNVDIEYGFQLNDSTKTDILVFTEREKKQIRIFSVPDMNPLDGGGFIVFEDEANEDFRLPMGIAVYKKSKTNEISIIVGRKSGPREDYLYQYNLTSENGKATLKLSRKFGSFSGKKEIEAIVVDDELGFIYYSDEGNCIRKYHADPDMGNKEISCFGGEFFKDDIEGIAIVSYPEQAGYLIVSDQQRHSFNIFSRKDNSFVKRVYLGTTETDGCDAVSVPLNNTFNKGLFVAMNNDKNFYFYKLEKILPNG